MKCRVVGEMKYENLISNEFLESNCHRKEVSDLRHCVPHDYHARNRGNFNTRREHSGEGDCKISGHLFASIE